MDRITISFERQGLMRTLGAVLERLVAVGQVVQAGRTLTVCEGTVYDATRSRVLAKMTTTMMAVPVASA